MRITDRMMTQNFMRTLHKNLEQVDGHNQKLASGRRINAPSDDPVGTARSMQLNSTLESTEQYLKNIDYGRAWMETTEEALSRAGDIMQRARELTLYGYNETLSETDREALAAELRELRESLLELSETTHAGRHVFSGYQTDQPPFAEDNGELDFQGDSSEQKLELGHGIEMTINVDGEEAFADAFEVLEELADNFANGEEEDENEYLNRIDDIVDQNLASRSDIGARINRIDLTEDRLRDLEISLKSLLSETEDVDIAETIMELRMSESVYRASLATGARIIQPTLVDFLR